jgi:hypothetical protein
MGPRDFKVVLIGSPNCVAAYVNSSMDAELDPAARPHKHQSSTLKIKNQPNCCFTEIEVSDTVSFFSSIVTSKREKESHQKNKMICSAGRPNCIWMAEQYSI